MHRWSSILVLYKNCAIELAPVLIHLINKVVNNGTPPSTCLKALVTPVPKKTPPIDFSHLRPISVTPIMSRITERLVVRKYMLPALPSELFTSLLISLLVYCGQNRGSGQWILTLTKAYLLFRSLTSTQNRIKIGTVGVTKRDRQKDASHLYRASA